jgi:hypothetical protein
MEQKNYSTALNNLMTGLALSDVVESTTTDPTTH